MAPHLLMVIDDDDDIRETFTDLLRDEGYEVVPARNGEDALSMLRSGVRPHLILVDQTMPVMSGRDFREAQIADPALASIPIVLMTASSAVEDLVGDLRPAAVIKKPVGMDSLLATVHAALSTPPPSPPCAP